MTKKVRELIQVLEEHDWYFVRERGDHKIYKKKGCKRSVSVPGKMSKDIKVGLYYRILRETGIKTNNN